jgi:uncharacterized membrane protein YjjB (DUF3815 family)
MIVLIEAVCAFFSCFFFAIIYNTPKKELVYCGLSGAVGYTIYYIFDRYFSLSLLGTFIATICICIMAKYYSIEHKMPKLLYVLPAIFPIVPGAGIYYALHDIMINDYAAATNEGFVAFKTVGAVVLAMLIILPDQFFKFTWLEERNKIKEFLKK